MSAKFFKLYPESNKAIVRSVADAERLRNWIWRLIHELDNAKKGEVVNINDVGIEVEDDSRWVLDFKAIWEEECSNGQLYLDVLDARLVLETEYTKLSIFIDIPLHWFEYTPQQKSIEEIYGIL